MFHKSVLGLSRISQGLITIEIFKYLLYLLSYDKNAKKSRKKGQNALTVRKIRSTIFNFFSSQKYPLWGF